MKQNVKNKVKGGLLVLLMALCVVKGFAEEIVATIEEKVEGETEYYLSNSRILRLFADDYDFDRILARYAKEGNQIVYEDSRMSRISSITVISEDLVEVILADGTRKGIKDIYPDISDRRFSIFFPSAYAKYQRELGR
jgi:hypothetical protein